MIDLTPSTAPLRADFADEHHSMDDHPTIAHARDMLMRQRNINSQDAYLMLLDMANKKNMPVHKLSIQLIETAKRLTV